jgi:leader peptidase (prepilin peptidase) / N-methyltransferase
MAPHYFFIVFLFVLGSCIGSFLNVLIYRLPEGISLWWPPSHCPSCKKRLAWYDNIPVIGWLALAGKCRYCREKISIRYPIIEAITGLLFSFYYIMFFMVGIGPCRDSSYMYGPRFLMELGPITPNDLWPIYFMDMVLLAGLLAASVIDAELYIIPASIPWWIGGAAIVAHTLVDSPGMPGAQFIWPSSMALSTGAGIGLLISIVLLRLNVIPLSFPEGDLLEHEREELEQKSKDAKAAGGESPEIPPEFTPAQVRAEMRKEMLFLLPPLALGGILMATQMYIHPVQHFWIRAAQHQMLNSFLGSLLGGMVGAFVVWLTRILGSYGFGREAMGLGDVHLMFGIGAVMGGGAAVIAFFLAPFFGIFVALYLFFTRTKRQLPYGPYLSLATAFVMLFYCPIAAQFRQGLDGLAIILHRMTGT